VIDEDKHVAMSAPPLVAPRGTSCSVEEVGDRLAPTVPDPSSSTFSPACFGGRGEISSTCVVALSSPTSPASTPMSASALVSSGLDFAAMIPLKDG
jgi:hypothetical protein